MSPGRWALWIVYLGSCLLAGLELRGIDAPVRAVVAVALLSVTSYFMGVSVGSRHSENSKP